MALSFVNVQSAQAQNLGWFDWMSPLAWFPTIDGEAKVRLIWMSVGNGSFIAQTNFAQDGGSLRNTFHLGKEELFLDSMVRFQLNRFSIRVAYEPRDFAGFRSGGTTYAGTLVAPLLAEARISYSGLRLGGDLDIVQWNRTRVGIDLDYDFFTPRFVYPSVSSASVGGGSIASTFSGPNAMTLGFHVVYNPLRTVFGGSPILEMRARWPVLGTEVTDWEIAGGIASPSTLLGSFSLMAGFRSTRVSYSAGDTSGLVIPTTPIVTFHPTFEAFFEGWFAEFAFYY